ncbi:MAG TPA: MmgE/PrpD family protein [Vicinamibacterales bacterium]
MTEDFPGSLLSTERRAAEVFGVFAAEAEVPAAARHIARTAWLDTIGVTLAGSVEPPARIVQRVCAGGGGPCRVLGTSLTTTAEGAALANGTSAHALDYDDMCFVSLAHPSAPLVSAALAAGEVKGASGDDLVDAYVVGFEIECVLGRSVNPTHYARGWHATSTLGTIGSAAAVARLLGLDGRRATHAISIAASSASGLKENFGTMVKPLHAGLAARAGVLAGLLAEGGFTASDAAIDGPQGFVAATSDNGSDLASAASGLGSRWEILETGVTVKLYPSCAATHPPLDAMLALRREHGFEADDIEAIDVWVDSVTPSVLIYPSPGTGLEAKFSLQFCLAAAAVHGRVGIDSFDESWPRDPRIAGLAPRVVMHVDEEIGRGAAPLTQALVSVRLRSGRVLSMRAHGARGYPERPASAQELHAKFRANAARVCAPEAVEEALAVFEQFGELPDVRRLTELLAHAGGIRTASG